MNLFVPVDSAPQVYQHSGPRVTFLAYTRVKTHRVRVHARDRPKYSVNNRGPKCTGRTVAIPIENGCRCGVSPIMSTIIQRCTSELEALTPPRCTHTGQYHSNGSIIHDAMVIIFLSTHPPTDPLSVSPLSLPLPSCLSSAIIRGRQAAVLSPYQKPQSTSISMPTMGSELP